MAPDARGTRIPRQMSESPGSVPLTLTDAWLLAALTESGGRDVSLRALVHDYDWLEREIPSFDELSYGLPRLIAAGLAAVHGHGRQLRLRATPKAMALRRSIPGHPISAIARLVGATADAGGGDRSLGRLAALDRDELASAVRTHGRRVMRWSAPFVAASWVIAWLQGRRQPHGPARGHGSKTEARVDTPQDRRP
jgi:hypothetical protein